MKTNKKTKSATQPIDTTKKPLSDKGISTLLEEINFDDVFQDVSTTWMFEDLFEDMDNDLFRGTYAGTYMSRDKLVKLFLQHPGVKKSLKNLAEDFADGAIEHLEIQQVYFEDVEEERKQEELDALEEEKQAELDRIEAEKEEAKYQAEEAKRAAAKAKLLKTLSPEARKELREAFNIVI